MDDSIHGNFSQGIMGYVKFTIYSTGGITAIQTAL